MSKVTDAMVEAALDVWFPMYPKGWQREDISENYRICMRAALEAALAVPPKDEAAERLAAWNAAELSAWPELEWAAKPVPEADPPDQRPCTCYPGEAPVPCQHKYAYTDCVRSWEAGRTRP